MAMSKTGEKHIVKLSKTKKGEERFQLSLKAVDTKKSVYIMSGTDLERLVHIRNKILAQGPLSEEDLKRVREQFRPPRKEPQIEKYIFYTRSGTYRIMHNGKGFGTYKTIEEARLWRDRLVKCDWDEDMLDLPVKRRNRNPLDKYIHKDSGGYFIVHMEKNEDGKVRPVRYDTCIPTLEEARKLRDDWVRINWDWEKIDLI